MTENTELVWREFDKERIIRIKNYTVRQRKNKAGGMSDIYEVTDAKEDYHSLYAFAIFYTKRHLERFLGVTLPQ